MKNVLFVLVVLTAVSTASSAWAETVALWHFDEGIVSNNATTLSSEYNPAIMEATAGTYSGGTLPYRLQPDGRHKFRP